MRNKGVICEFLFSLKRLVVCSGVTLNNNRTIDFLIFPRVSSQIWVLANPISSVNAVYQTISKLTPSISIASILIRQLTSQLSPLRFYVVLGILI
jgi:hypothetical protein